MKKLFIKSYGCQMNFYDSNQISNLLKKYNYTTTNDVKHADLIVLNTCHIRDKAVEKTYSDLGRIRKSLEISGDKNTFKNKPIVAVAGCVAQAQGEEIIKRSPWVDIVVGPQAYTDLPKLISKVNKAEKKRLVNLDFPTIPKFDLLDHSLNEKKISTFLTVQEGCDKFCTFCVVPYTRGPEFSRSVSSILDEVKSLIHKGAKEIILLGQNVNAWKGQNIDGKDLSFGKLLEKIASFDEILSIRYTTSHPLDMDIELLNAHKNLEKLMPYIHLPIQSGSDQILKKMNRRHTVKDYLKIIEKIRRYKPDIAISSDFIVGFPGETEQDHKQTLKLIDEVKFSSSFSFKYSQRPGTPSANLKSQVDEETKKERLKELQYLLKKQQFKYNRSFLKSSVKVLIINVNKKGQFVGKSPYNQTVFCEDKNLKSKNVIGQMVSLDIIDAFQNSLFGTQSN